MGTPVLTAIAAFAEAFVNPLAPLLALGAALVVANHWRVRAILAGAGCLVPLAGHLDEGFAVLAPAMLGAAAAFLLHAEIALHLVFPVLRWTWRCLVTAWELVWLTLAIFRSLLHRAHPRRPQPPEKDRTP
jgi:hypothetical protein